jgi:hypothetical protein
LVKNIGISVNDLMKPLRDVQAALAFGQSGGGAELS